MSTREVSPLDVGIGKNILVSAGLVLDGILDVEKLRPCVYSLVDSWPELSFVTKRALTSLGDFVSIPVSDRSSVDFRHRTLDSFLRDVFPLPTPSATSVSEHPIDAAHVDDLFRFETWSPSSYGFVRRPTLTFRVTLLKDATLLNMDVPHVFADGQAIAAILRAVALLYRGEQLPPPPANPHPDLLNMLPPSILEHAPEDDPCDPAKHMITSNWAAIKNSYDLIRMSWKGVEERLVHFPGPVLTRIRDEARANAGPADVEGKGLPVSQMDVACALLVKIYAHAVPSENLPFDFYHASDMSSFFPDLPVPYLHNIFHMLHIAFPSAAHIRATPPAALAQHIRSAVNAQRTVRGAARQLAWHAAHRDLLHIVPRVARAHGWGTLTAWTRMRLDALDFSAGVRVAFVRPRLAYAFGAEVANAALANADGRGGMWMDVKVPAGAWDAIWKAAGFATL